MIEDELAKHEPKNKQTTDGSDKKKNFLKRKNLNSTAKKALSSAKKNYKYYADNFQRDKVKKLNFDSS